MESLYFASYANEEEDLLSNYLLAKSIKDFTGNLSVIPLHIYLPDSLLPKTRPIMHKFKNMNTAFHGYTTAENSFDYSFKPASALAAERNIGNGTIFWFDRHMIALNSCADLILNETEKFSWRPPHLRIIGSLYDTGSITEKKKILSEAATYHQCNINPDELWETIYKIAGVNKNRSFPVYSVVDRQKIHAYFYACHFSFRAESGLMKEWNELFTLLQKHEQMQPFLKDETVRIFLHQISLTMAVLKNCDRDELRALPLYYGYPTHLYGDFLPEYQARDMTTLNTACFAPDYQESIFPNMPVSEYLQKWIIESIKKFREPNNTENF
jgi:hypothetical protein